MNLERFLRERQGLWSELERLCDRAGRRPERLGPQGVRRLGTLYRSAAADLSIARRRFPADPVRRRLEELVGRARSLVYGTQARRGSLVGFFTTTYWRRIRERPVPLVVAAVLLLGPALLAALWASSDPGAASGLLPGSLESVSRPRPEGADLGLSAEAKAAFSTFIFTNNIRVTFLAFAGGIVAGIGTAYVLAFNGLLLGVITGLAVGAGNGGVFLELVAPHGVLELSCIVVGAAAGMRLGWALVDPGHRPRGDALVDEGRRAVEIVLGTVPWLVGAGLVEGFVTPSGYGLAPALTVGFGLAAVFWILVAWRGTPEPSEPGQGLGAQVGADAGRTEAPGWGLEDGRPHPA